MIKIIEKIKEFIKNYVSTARSTGVVVGMSGGKDSFVAAKLCSEAVGVENVFGVIMPNGEMADIEIAKQECEILGIKYAVVNIEKITKEIEKKTKEIDEKNELNQIAEINISPRIRMTYLYTIAANKNYLVVNTSNLSETMIGYSTKWGDGVGDFAPLADFTKTEVCEIGVALGLPENLVNKKPDDGLSGKTDEEKIGFSYDELDNFIRNGIKDVNFSKIEKMHNASHHKRQPICKFESNRKNYFKR